jgi:glycosyltransferase involved in cell wall biosynthesis
VGKRGQGYENILAHASIGEQLQERVIFTGRVDDEDLAALYSGALCFTFMSYYEGFGLPPLEAMQCGVPVITSNTSSLPEVVGDAGITVNPKDEDALCQAMLGVYRDEHLRAEMARKSLVQAAKFSWDKCVVQTVQGYQKALNA